VGTGTQIVVCVANCLLASSNIMFILVLLFIISSYTNINSYSNYSADRNLYYNNKSAAGQAGYTERISYHGSVVCCSSWTNIKTKSTFSQPFLILVSQPKLDLAILINNY